MIDVHPTKSRIVMWHLNTIKDHIFLPRQTKVPICVRLLDFTLFLSELLVSYHDEKSKSLNPSTYNLGWRGKIC